MELFSKNFSEISEEDINNIVSNPNNFEDFQIEYKLDYDSDADELRRDITQFTNGFKIGYIIYGMADNPIKIVGIERNRVDALKVVLNNVLNMKISPLLTPLPEYNPVPLSNGKFIFIIKIEPKSYGVFGIRKTNNMSSPRDYKTFEFYKRLDGSKHQMDTDELAELIETKARLRNLPDIPTEVGLRDERIELLVIAIKNLTIKYYREGVLNNRFDNTISEKIFEIIMIVDKLKPHYMNRFAPDNSISHSKIIGTYFNHITVERFKERVVNDDILPENIKRTIFMHAGDISYAIYEFYKNKLKRNNILLDELRRDYQNLIQTNELSSFRENYKESTFNEALTILEAYGIIRTTGEYAGSDCVHTYDIKDLNRLQKFIEKYSLEYLH
ncbi:hypothetical protein LCGC14_1415800 [marine sediment metagenome]|uniref:Schlafen AlbA-2 domain-containing protein n=1 Tax=marine sediment metagenome TaxID=412755 RepID=A0A0F9MUL4_9ZZZZ